MSEVEQKLKEIFGGYEVKKCEDCTIREGWYPTVFFCKMCLKHIKPTREMKCLISSRKETSKRTK